MKPNRTYQMALGSPAAGTESPIGSGNQWPGGGVRFVQSGRKPGCREDLSRGQPRQTGVSVSVTAREVGRSDRPTERSPLVRALPSSLRIGAGGLCGAAELLREIHPTAATNAIGHAASDDRTHGSRCPSSIDHDGQAVSVATSCNVGFVSDQAALTGVHDPIPGNLDQPRTGHVSATSPGSEAELPLPYWAAGLRPWTGSCAGSNPRQASPKTAPALGGC
jgi:hypothetical protein